MLAPPDYEYTDLLLTSVPKMDLDWLDNLLAGRSNETVGRYSGVGGLAD